MSSRVAEDDDVAYIYRLCEATMRTYVEADLGDCFERVAHPTIQKLVQGGNFYKIYVADELVGAVAHEQHRTHIQLEEIYIEAARQNQGIGAEVVRQLIARSNSLGLPVRLHVLASNPARRFYERLGFSIPRSTNEVNYFEYTPRRLTDA